ncbi:ATP-binding protein [Lignipirellula cremea]|uniref:histidine kinase n=1 Tax=Lignipirellula cremea TaxID=2528010 RepID=A0A518DR12_9BACT|nr:ATP-binding protein [Lignipirellula cremea]QDU94271.1 Sensor protein ZraS [Lignipirellula cremea]
MFLSRHPTIASRLVLVMSLSTGAAIAFSCVAFLWSEMGMIRAHKVRETETVARQLAVGVARDISEQDLAAAAAQLQRLVEQPSISYACLYSADGLKIAEFQPGREPEFVPPQRPQQGRRIEDSHVEVTQPVNHSGQHLGHVFVRSTTTDSQHRAYRFGAIAAVVMIASLCVATMLTFGLQRWIAHPLVALAELAQRISEEGDLALRVGGGNTTDEIGLLRAQFDRMLERIQQGDKAIRSAQSRLEERVTQRTRELMEVNDKLMLEMKRRDELSTKLIDVSRTAGMAEVANGVLHNVGNVLNSVTVSASLIRETVRCSEARDLVLVLNMIQQHRDDLHHYFTDDERGRLLPDYLARASAILEQERTSLQQRTEELCKNVEHIRDVIATQQSYTGLSGVMESVAIAELIEDAVQINASSINKRNIQIQRDFAVTPTLVVDKRKVLQILVNLIKNAVHAVEEVKEGRIRLELSLKGEWAQIRVVDNGVGIAAGNLDRIFQHGFTTRRDGHGLGLHSGAIAAKEHGWSIAVESPGPGLGATFTLSLPRRSEASRPGSTTTPPPRRPLLTK